MRKRPILIVEDEPEMREVLFEGLSQNGYAVHLAENAEKGFQLYEKNPFDLIISDVRLPGMSGLQLLETIRTTSSHIPVIMITGYGTVQDAVNAMKKGAFDYLLKPFSLEILHRVVEAALPGNGKKETPAPPGASSFILTRNIKVKEILDLCRRIGPSKATVLIQGESGTGKELLARYIHAQSDRRQGPFVGVNCASLPENLLESELFGHERGAFTGAIGRKMGKFELAHLGTILLDEISEMNTVLQAKILRVLQEHELDRVGGTHPIPIDTRVIATTNRDLEDCIKQGDFREDLFYRLNVIAVTLPTLRERVEDIEVLALHFLEMFSDNYGKTIHSISESASAWLRRQQWRGNIRELKNRVERAVLMTDRPVLEVEDFSPEERIVVETPMETDGSSLSLRDMERRAIFEALEKTQGNRTHASKILGISIRTLRNKLNEYKMGTDPAEING